VTVFSALATLFSNASGMVAVFVVLIQKRDVFYPACWSLEALIRNGWSFICAGSR